LATNLLQPERTCHKKSTGSDSIDPVSSDDPISSSSSSGGDDALISSWLVAEEDAVVDLVALATANKVALLISTLTSHRTKNVDLLVDGIVFLLFLRLVATWMSPGRTALFAACKYGHVECANVLVQHGADVNFQCAEGTPLSAALMSNNKECVQLLLAHSANPNFVDFCTAIYYNYLLINYFIVDCTPLHIACYNGLHEMVSLLLSVDSSLTLRDKSTFCIFLFYLILSRWNDPDRLLRQMALVPKGDPRCDIIFLVLFVIVAQQRADICLFARGGGRRQVYSNGKTIEM